MMNDELNSGDAGFEKRLQQVAPREIPPAWRKEILAAAQSASASSHAPSTTHHCWLATLIAQLSTSFRPQRLAWSGLGAAWVAILLLNHLGAAPATTLAQTRALPSPQAWQALKQQKQLLAELDERATAPAAERPRPGKPGPRSQRPVTTTNV